MVKAKLAHTKSMISMFNSLIAFKKAKIKLRRIQRATMKTRNKLVNS